MASKTSISARLKEIRLDRQLSVAELAQQSGLSQPYIWQIESGKRGNPSAETVKKLAEGLGVSVEDLIVGPKSIAESDLEEVPDSLREFLKKRGKSLGVRKEDVEVLKHISYRGCIPQTVQDWELIFVFLQRMLSK